MTQPLRIEQLDQSLRANGLIEVQHAVQLRRMIYAKGHVSKSDAEILFRLDHVCSKKDAAFAGLYVEALTDYFVWQTDPKGYVTPEQARVLIDNVASDGHVAGKTEMELLLSIVHWAREVPGELTALVLESVRQAVLLSRKGPQGGNRPRVSIGAGDVEILRKALHAPAGDGSLLVTRREAELLFCLNEAAGTGESDPAWTEFFKLALANHLLNPMTPPTVPTRDEAVQRERWLNERGSIGQMLSAVGASVVNGNVPFASVWESLDPTGAVQARKEVQAERETTRLRLSREQVDADEAKWLCERILRDGTVDENERALLVYLRNEAPHIDPALEPAMKRAGV